jgi:hypothetical protein
MMAGMDETRQESLLALSVRQLRRSRLGCVAMVLVAIVGVWCAFIAWEVRGLSRAEARLVGTWGDPDYYARQYNDHFTLTFRGDRSFLYARPPASRPVKGSWAIDGDRLVLRYDGGTMLQNLIGRMTSGSVEKWKLISVDDALTVRVDGGKSAVRSYPAIRVDSPD